MKNMLLKFGAAVLFVSAVFFAGCAGSPDDGNKITQAVKPGTVGQPPESLFAASKLAQEIDPALTVHMQTGDCGFGKTAATEGRDMMQLWAKPFHALLTEKLLPIGISVH